MKRFETFGEYMFDLLFAPLKKGKRTVNQFFIFFKVIGRVFDGLKADALRVRDETNVATASSVMLPVHGQDRNMPRLAGESVEGYRTRLAMKSIIAEKGGLKEGIQYALAALGYEQSAVEPFAFQDPERWAEFIIHLKSSKQNGINNLDAILAEVNKVKEGSSKLYGIILEYAATPFVETPGRLIFRRFAVAVAFSSRRSFPPLRLDGSWPLDGSALLGAVPSSMFGFPHLRLCGCMAKNLQSISRAALIMDTMYTLDGSILLDGSRKLSADITQEEL